MMNLYEVLGSPLGFLLNDTEIITQHINQYYFVKEAFFDKTSANLHIDFIEDVDVEGQDILNLFIRGGMIKRKSPKKGEEEYFKVEPINYRGVL